MILGGKVVAKYRNIVLDELQKTEARTGQVQDAKPAPPGDARRTPRLDE